MAISIIEVDVVDIRTKKQNELLELLNSKRVQKQANEILKDYINKFVPKDTGALRRSAKVTNETISWGLGLDNPYAIYQYNGEIFGPNYPIIKGGRIVGWYSKPGQKKYPTGRMMGPYRAGNSWLGYNFGYSEPGTSHHWDEKFRKSLRWKAQANREITRYLKSECKKRGLNK